MTLFVAWAVAAAGGALALGLGILWRRAVRHSRAREQLWRNALHSLAARDYDGARTLAAMMTGAPGADAARMPSRASLELSHEGASLADALREAADALQAGAREQERARRELEDVLASLQDAVLVVDGESRLRFLNASALGLFAVRVEDVLGASLLEALPSFGLEAAVREALHEGRSTMREVSLYGAQVREVFLRVAPVRRSRGEVSGAVAILQDLTEMRRLERVRRDFVANASHELRTPIANIRAGAETILSDPGDARMAARFLPNLVAESERLSRLVTDLLDLARAESTADTPRAPVDLTTVAAGVVQRLSDKAAQNNIVLRCDYGEAPVQEGAASAANGAGSNGLGGARVVGDAAALEQVVFNLLDNALMYTPAGGEITLRIRRVGVASPVGAASAASPNGRGDAAPGDRATDGGTATGAALHARANEAEPKTTALDDHASSGADAAPSSVALSSVALSVSDTGIGIPAAEQERIFERFYRVDKARSRTQGGTGLGLAIVKHIVENHGGHVTVQSEAGQGSTFTVTLPAM